MKRSIEELNLMDDFLFQEVMRSPEFGVEFCQILLSTLLRRKIRIASVRTQEVISSLDTDLHGIRLDVFADSGKDETLLEEEGGALYDVEMQCEKDGNVAKRIRYYQAVTDVKNLASGEDYENLPNLWTIVITPTDYFGRNRMLYTFESRCAEEANLPLNDGAVRLFVYTRGQVGCWREAQELLHYIEQSTQENAGSPELKKIHEMITKVKNNREAGVRYMRMLEQLKKSRQEGWEEGLSCGIAQGEQALGTLISILIENGQMDEIEKVLLDANYRKELYQKYQVLKPDSN